jgi:WD40 repeat protein
MLGSSLEYLSLSAQFGYVGDPLTPLAAVAVGASTDTQRVEIIDVRTGRMSAVVDTHSAPQYSGAAFDRAGKVVLLTAGSVASTAPAELSSARGGEALHVLPTHALGGALSPDGKLALTLDAKKVLMVWDVASGRRLTVFRAHSRHSLGGGVLLTVSFKFSPDGKLVLSSDTAGYGYVWTARSGCVLNAIRGPAEPPGMWSGWGGAISPDDRLAVTVASWDSAAHVDEVGRPRALLTLRGSQQDIEDAAFSPDSSLLATISGDERQAVDDTGKQSGPHPERELWLRDHLHRRRSRP